MIFKIRYSFVTFSKFGIRPPQATKLNPGLKREQLNRSFEKSSNNNTRFGSIHDELEFRKRYKRISDLKNHLQFVNGSYLSGKNIIAEERKLAPTTNFNG
jgi:NifB/MoaA-like Fe-S oxidoreductase